MKTIVVILAASVSTANVFLNYFAHHTARSSSTWPSMFTNASFYFAFAIGMASLLCMLSLYFIGKTTQISMANGVLLMGAASITIGTLWGRFGLGDSVHWTEWVILILILTFLGIRYVVYN